MITTYFLAGSTILFILFLVLFLMTKNKARQLQNAKKQEVRIKRQQLTKTANVLKWVSILTLVAVIISGVVALSKGSAGTNNGSISEEAVTLPDIHGLGYSHDGGSIMLPAHDGIKLYFDGKWSEGQEEKHDYMGFSAVNDGFYSSGHPARGSSKKNPFGIVKSTDGGNSFKTLTLYGKVDFHLMGVGFNKHTIYVVNLQSNSEMKETGLYYSDDEAQTWEKSEMVGFNDEAAALAVHPDNDAIVALGSQTGLYISKDHGDNFEKLSDFQVTFLYFNLAGKLIVGGYAQGATLSELDIEKGEKTAIKIPALTEDAVMYVAQNPVDEQELVFATFNKDVYVSNDRGGNWTKIADKGNGIFQ